MWQAKEFALESIENYLRVVPAKVRYPSCFVGSPRAGDRVILGRGSYVVRGAQLSYGVRLGEVSYVNCGAILRSEELGLFCSIGPYAIIGPPEHSTSFFSTLTKLYAPDILFGAPPQWNIGPDPPRIGSGVSIGAFALVREGVRIGHGAVVSAGAVVTHKVPPCGIAAGVPARAIRCRSAADLVAELLETHWWRRSTGGLAPDQQRFPMPWKGAACREVAR